jgi:hypothetical protein
MSLVLVKPNTVQAKVQAWEVLKTRGLITTVTTP